jgi:hypothetical protein
MKINYEWQYDDKELERLVTCDDCQEGESKLEKIRISKAVPNIVYTQKFCVCGKYLPKDKDHALSVDNVTLLCTDCARLEQIESFFK